MDIPDLFAHDTHAAALLKNILEAIRTVIPDATLTINADELTHNIAFNIQRGKYRRRVEVTEAFLDADDGLNSAMYGLVDLPIGTSSASMICGHWLGSSFGSHVAGLHNNVLTGLLPGQALDRMTRDHLGGRIRARSEIGHRCLDGCL